MTITTWLTSAEKDYQQGLQILSELSKNVGLVRTLRRNHNPEKLEYELKKLAGIPPADIWNQKVSNAELLSRYANTRQSSPSRVHNAQPDDVQNTSQQHVRTGQTTTTPEPIARAKQYIYELYTKISSMHRQLFDIGDSNQFSAVKKRKNILTARLPLIDAYEQLYVLKEQYYNTGMMQIPSALPDALNTAKKLLNETTLEADKPPEYLPVNVETYTDLELAKRKNQLASSITKTKNKLLYQSISKLSTESPMPNGPKRTQLEKNLKNLQTEYTSVVKELEKRTKK